MLPPYPPMMWIPHHDRAHPKRLPSPQVLVACDTPQNDNPPGPVAADVGPCLSGKEHCWDKRETNRFVRRYQCKYTGCTESHQRLEDETRVAV